MADVCTTYTYAGVTINGPVGTDCLVVDIDGGEINGLDGRPIRRQIDPLAGTDGGDSQAAYWAHRIITFKGVVQVGSVPNSDVTVYRAALMAVQASVITALEGQLNSNATLAWTPANGGAHSIGCMYGVPGGEIKFGGPVFKTAFEFSLLAEDPDISVA